MIAKKQYIPMKKQLTNYDGQYREKVSFSSASYINSESIRERSGLYNWQISPHLHIHLIQLFFIETGFVKVEMADGSHEIKAPAILVIPPRHLHGFTYDPMVKGRVITLGVRYIEKLLQSAAGLLLNLKNIEFITEFNNEIPFNDLIDITLQIDKELFGDLEERQIALQSLLSLLFLRLFRLIDDSSGSIPNSLQEKYYHSFQKSYKNSVPFTKTIPDYAAELNITPVHLNRICKAVTGRSGSWILQEHAIAEAQKLLTFTSYSLTEITYLLNFSDTAYFSRLFRKHAGITPGLFRKQ